MELKMGIVGMDYYIEGTFNLMNLINIIQDQVMSSISLSLIKSIYINYLALFPPFLLSIHRSLPSQPPRPTLDLHRRILSIRTAGYECLLHH